MCWWGMFFFNFNMENTLQWLFLSSEVIIAESNINRIVRTVKLVNVTWNCFWYCIDTVDDIDVDFEIRGNFNADECKEWLTSSSMVKLSEALFSYDQTNYATHGAHSYYCCMEILVKIHQQIHEQHMHGQFAVQMSEVNPFGNIPEDQTI